MGFQCQKAGGPKDMMPPSPPPPPPPQKKRPNSGHKGKHALVKIT